MSVSSAGVQGNNTSYTGACSADGRFVAFASTATNLVSSDTNGFRDCFVRDVVAGTTELISISSSGVQGNGESFPFAMSADGRCVAFSSAATNLVAGDTNQAQDVFVRDRQAGTTERVSVSSSGLQADGFCSAASISSDGKFVAFVCYATNLVPSDTNGYPDVFLRNRSAGTTIRISVSSAGLQGNEGCSFVALSGDAHYAAFSSSATNLVAGDTNQASDVFVRDIQAETTERISVDTAGLEGNGTSLWPSISSDGRYVAFTSEASNLVAGDTNGNSDVFVRNRLSGTTERASVSSAGAQGNSQSRTPSISFDGRFLAFGSQASNLVSSDTNGTWDVFVRDRLGGTTELVSMSSAGVQGNQASEYPSFSGDGRFVGFDSQATNLVTGDTNGTSDAFVRDRASTGFASLCDPGLSGVIPCPCANPPAGPGRGCDNSAATGGAQLSASGVAYLSMDSLVFTTGGENPTATSILLQGDALIPSGIVFGQGVRCVGGSLKRLYVRSAVGGSISAPGAGDPTVSARSAQMGDPIQPGQARFYNVYYRNPLVSGGCSAASTFNATQTASIAWWP